MFHYFPRGDQIRKELLTSLGPEIESVASGHERVRVLCAESEEDWIPSDGVDGAELAQVRCDSEGLGPVWEELFGERGRARGRGETGEFVS